MIVGEIIRRKTLKVLLLGVVALGFASPVFAGESGRPDLSALLSDVAKEAFQEICLTLGKDKDGKLSKVEFQGMYRDADMTESKFQTWDVDRDGYLTEAEYVSVVAKIGGRK